MKKYRIWASHCGDSSEIVEEFFAKSNKEAREKFEKEKKRRYYAYDYLWMDRVDQEEKVTQL